MRSSWRVLLWIFGGGLAALPLQNAMLAGDETHSDAKRETAELVLSVRTWVGEYSSQDVPGGVKGSPIVGSIYTINADGSGLTKVVQPGQDANAAVFSPDGKWLYFQSNASGRSQFYRCRPDGSGLEQFTASERLGPPWNSVYGLQMTPRGQLLGAVHDGTSARVCIMSPDGSHIRVVAPHLGYLYMSAISPDGGAVVCSGPANDYRLWLLKLPDAFETGESRLSGPSIELAPLDRESFAPQFTPDGQTIVYFRRDGDIRRVQSDGSGHQRLTTGNQYVEFRLSEKDQHGSTDGPHLSPDGTRIAFIALCDGVPNVCVINLDGSGQKQLTFRKTPCGRVRWSPDGRQLAFVSFEGKFPQLFVMDAAGGEPRQLTRLEGAVYFVAWNPAGLN